ncbi:DUF2993 domain-containing protein [Romeria aff. gracilis LEGE 07310]|uniref:DUF2993 domain-containing protein n=1 Tax=Vasconcelosia minhoensis LEGE 07310 TaxID=915328 RepID=A0A8J7DM47_9CYAN|nr:DUF2993 domain-containing protein [Romeria gracilis]MBE9078246.1 DUF2993 domain-containing protein [Romeria aff. gracilis LEGE 07310]
MPANKTVSGIISGTALVLTATVLASCSPAGYVERGIERELPKYIGPADSYDVDIEGLQLRSNQADRVFAVGERVRPDGSPVLDRLELELRGVEFNRDQGRLERVESAGAVALVRPDDLAVFLANSRNVQDAEIALLPPNQATIRVRPSIGEFNAPPGVTVDIAGELVGSGSQLSFDVSSVRAAGINLGSGVAQRLSREINPLADLSGLPVTLTIKDVRVDDGAIRVEVTGDPSSFQLPVGE